MNPVFIQVDFSFFVFFFGGEVAAEPSSPFVFLLFSFLLLLCFSSDFSSFFAFFSSLIALSFRFFDGAASAPAGVSCTIVRCYNDSCQDGVSK